MRGRSKAWAKLNAHMPKNTFNSASARSVIPYGNSRLPHNRLMQARLKPAITVTLIASTRR